LRSISDVLEEAKQLGLLGPGPIDVHIRHALGFAETIANSRQAERGRFVGSSGLDPEGTGLHLLDLGSGGGVPGLILAQYWPAASVTLLEVVERRCRLLDRWVVEVGMSPRVSVACGRAEELGREPALRGSFDAVVSRSFGAPAVTAECGAPFLKLDGLLVVSEPPGTSADPENYAGSENGDGRWPAKGLEALGLEKEGSTMKPFHFVILNQSKACPDRYPRRTGMPAKRPLF
jgi:16S rRNA (guanine527-N7)-methyltransferase